MQVTATALWLHTFHTGSLTHLAMVTGLLSWLYGLRYVPLNIAFNLSGLVQVMLPLSCWWLLGGKIGPIRWCVIALVCAGVCVIARPLMQVEEKL